MEGTRGHGNGHGHGFKRWVGAHGPGSSHGVTSAPE